MWCSVNLYILPLYSSRSYKTQFVVIPQGHLWVEGDNSRTSKDSNLFGPVRSYAAGPIIVCVYCEYYVIQISEGLVEGIVSHVVWPPHRWRKVEHNLLASQIERTHHTTEL